jgi:hypothetical protein
MGANFLSTIPERLFIGGHFHGSRSPEASGLMMAVA